MANKKSVRAPCQGRIRIAFNREDIQSKNLLLSWINVVRAEKIIFKCQSFLPTSAEEKPSRLTARPWPACVRWILPAQRDQDAAVLISISAVSIVGGISIKEN